MLVFDQINEYREDAAELLSNLARRMSQTVRTSLSADAIPLGDGGDTPDGSDESSNLVVRGPLSNASMMLDVFTEDYIAQTLLSQAREIYRVYVEPGKAEFEINISAPILRNIEIGLTYACAVLHHFISNQPMTGSFTSFDVFAGSSATRSGPSCPFHASTRKFSRVRSTLHLKANPHFNLSLHLHPFPRSLHPYLAPLVSHLPLPLQTLKLPPNLPPVVCRKTITSVAKTS